MRHERATEELRELAALYALGSLTQQEARSFEIHLTEGCSVCEAEHKKYCHAVAGIAFASEEITAPDYIRDLLSARIDRESPRTPPQALPNPAREEISMHELIPPRRPAPSLLSQPKPNRTNIFPWVLSIVLALFGLFAVYAWRSAVQLNGRFAAQISAAQADSDNLEAQLKAQKEKAGNLDFILATVNKPETRMSRLHSIPPSISAGLLWDTAQNQCTVFGNFPAAPEGKRYQLWFFTPISKISAGYLNPNAEGFMTLPVPQEAVDATAVVVTIEPDNGSQIPTSPYFAVGRIE